jgi:tRNA(Arg) A34 adenosine deaminase TadA
MHERWMRLAIMQARLAPHHRWRLGAALVRSGRLYGVSTNRYRNDPRTSDYSGVSWHAEEFLLRQVGDARGATLYVARVTPGGSLAMARPCSRCSEIIVESGLKRVVWTTSSGLESCSVVEMERAWI